MRHSEPAAGVATTPHEAGRRGDGGGGLHLSPGQQVDKEGLVAGGGRLGRLAQRPLKLSADPGAAGIGGALRWRQEPENGPEEAGLGAFTVVVRGGPESEVRAVHRCAKPLAGVALWAGCRVVAGEGVVRVRAGDECGCIVGESGLALVGRTFQGREFGNLAGE